MANLWKSRPVKGRPSVQGSEPLVLQLRIFVPMEPMKTFGLGHRQIKHTTSLLKPISRNLTKLLRVVFELDSFYLGGHVSSLCASFLTDLEEQQCSGARMVSAYMSRMNSLLSTSEAKILYGYQGQEVAEVLANGIGTAEPCVLLAYNNGYLLRHLRHGVTRRVLSSSYYSLSKKEIVSSHLVTQIIVKQ